VISATVLEEARTRFEAIAPDIGAGTRDLPQFRWALATGYSCLGRTLHRIEEMIVTAQPDHAVTGDALHDALCLSGSTMADREVLSIRLRTALQVISPNAARSFLPVAGVPADAAPVAAARPAADGRPSDAEAREVLREVRFAVNDFRDSRVDGIIRARNRLLWVVPRWGSRRTSRWRCADLGRGQRRVLGQRAVPRRRAAGLSIGSGSSRRADRPARTTACTGAG
jgi:hypothetical protein